MHTLARTLLAAFAVASLGGGSLSAQQPAGPVVLAHPTDVESVDAIIHALYASISGPKDQERDWPRLRSLLVPGARLMPTGRTAQGEGRIRVWNVDEYIAAAGPGLTRTGFFEREIGRTVERYGNIVHVMSAYDSKYLPTDPQPFARGINSIQLWNDGTRWWVVSILWEAETPGNPIPTSMLRAP